MIEVGVQNFALENQPHELAFAGQPKQAGVFKLLNMMGEGRSRNGLVLADIGAQHALAAGAGLLEDLVAVRVGESLGDEVQLALPELDGLLRSVPSLRR